MSIQTADNGDHPLYWTATTENPSSATVTYLPLADPRDLLPDPHVCAFADTELERVDLENERLRMVVKRLRERLANGD